VSKWQSLRAEGRSQLEIRNRGLIGVGFWLDFEFRIVIDVVQKNSTGRWCKTHFSLQFH
jgi:hypothetical protein